MWLVAAIVESSALENALFWEREHAVFFCTVPTMVRKQEILYLSKNNIAQNYIFCKLKYPFSPWVHIAVWFCITSINIANILIPIPVCK